MSDDELRVKYEAGAHIDELVGISKRGKETAPDDGSHKWADEWNYRTVFFEDSKGDKYRMRISVGINPDEAAAYNIGDIQKRGYHRNGPSSAISDGGALNGDAPREIVYHDKSKMSSEGKTDFEIAYEKALAKSGGEGQYSFALQDDIDSALADFDANYGDMYRNGLNYDDVNYDVDLAIGEFQKGDFSPENSGLFHPKNVENREAFRLVTGIKLPNTKVGTDLYLLYYANKNALHINLRNIYYNKIYNRKSENKLDIYPLENYNKHISSIKNAENIQTPPEYYKTINEKLEGKTHEKTGVSFIRKEIDVQGKIYSLVVPEFESCYDATISSELYYKRDRVQFKECYRQLFELVKTDVSLKNKFTESEWNDLLNGKKLANYTWHHHEETGKLQLVDRKIHRMTGHTGGRAIWGGGSAYR